MILIISSIEEFALSLMLLSFKNFKQLLSNTAVPTKYYLFHRMALLQWESMQYQGFETISEIDKDIISIWLRQS